MSQKVSDILGFNVDEFDKAVQGVSPFEKAIQGVNPDSEEGFDLGELVPGSCATEFLTGSAGTGKTYQIGRRLASDASYGLLCATTGIAAINLGEGVTTVNAALRYFDTSSLTDAYVSGQLVRRLRRIAEQGWKNVVVDEVSMMPAEQLDTLMRALDDLAGQETAKPLGLVLTGDFCQLPPVKARWAFEAECWPRFERNTTRLTKCWRQADGPFLEALSQMRQGKGGPAADLLNGQVEYSLNSALDFDGTSIMSKNDEVDRFNWACHQKVEGRVIESKATRWGQQKGEWKLVPETLKIKEGAYVMILANARANPEDDDFIYVNGDCGWVRGFDEKTGAFHVELKRNREVVTVAFVTRKNEQKEEPDGYGRDPKAYYDERRKRWIVSEIVYMPLRLAYATTVHKAQGLTLDAVQINLSNAFFGQPAMAYVAFSRCRSAQGLRVVGSPELLRRRVCVDPKVVRFL